MSGHCLLISVLSLESKKEMKIKKELKINMSTILAGMFILIFLCHGPLFPKTRNESIKNQGRTGSVKESAIIKIKSDSDIHELDKVIVADDGETRAAGKRKLKKSVIRSLPGGNGNATDMLRILPGITLDDGYRNTETGGEIQPAEMSISGGKFYQNNFSIDGMSNNSRLDPANKDTDDRNDVPGHSQSMFLDADLIKSISVYDSNVPAEFGGFTGGVVNAETVDPGPVFGGKVSYRGTGSCLTWFHVPENRRHVFEHSSDSDAQPDFQKHDGGIFLNIPLTDNSGVIVSCNLLYSRIPLEYFGHTKSQWRMSQQYFAKYVYDISDESSIEYFINYSPYRGEYFKSTAKDSDYNIWGGGFGTGTVFSSVFNSGELTINAGYSRNENCRRAPKNYKSWIITDSKPWGNESSTAQFSKEGGYGDLDKVQHSAEVQSHFQFSDFNFLFMNHLIKTGVSYQWLMGIYDRKETSYNYRCARANTDVISNGNSEDCVEGEQFFTERTVSEKSYVNAVVNQIDWYIQDIITFKRLELHPGVRMTYDDFLKNLNVSPRFAFNLDIFGTNKTLLIGGLNRYYGSSLLTCKLREAQKPVKNEKRTSYLNQPTEWQLSADKGLVATKYSGLKTPYSDETAAGIDQYLLGGRLKLKYVLRNGKDEFSRQLGPVEKDGIKYYRMTNNGHSRSHLYSLSYETVWFKRHTVLFSAEWSQTSSSNLSYDDKVDEQENDEVFYKGKIIKKWELPADDFTKPVNLKFAYSVVLPFGFSFCNYTNFKNSHTKLLKTNRCMVVEYVNKEGELDIKDIREYRKVHAPLYLVFDWKLSWEFKFCKTQSITLNVEVDNVFNRKNKLYNSSEDKFETGRQFWLGLDYKF